MADVRWKMVAMVDGIDSSWSMVGEQITGHQCGTCPGSRVEGEHCQAVHGPNLCQDHLAATAAAASAVGAPFCRGRGGRGAATRDEGGAGEGRGAAGGIASRNRERVAWGDPLVHGA
jgi:hypothetical protein